jgi:hypothetical protein
MKSLNDQEIVAADVVVRIVDGTSEKVTRMRREPNPQTEMLYHNSDEHLTRFEIDRLLRTGADAA